MVTEIRVPRIGVSTVKASIGRWFKRVGDPVSANEPLVEVEIDGTTVEVSASATGVLSEFFCGMAQTLRRVLCWERSQSRQPEARRAQLPR